jgi:1-acyl-sn-glycerol-3-phosphate acyltransferase
MKNKTIRHITTYSWSYRIASIFVDLMHFLFYRKIVVEGKENIPKNEPVIFAPNHQNALMDPLAILFTSNQQVVFLARGDIFHLPIVPGFFRWLKILPIYRIRNGISSLKNNDDSFDVAIKVLEKNRSIGLFPEAAHSNKRHLLRFKKGIPRIAFIAEEKHDFNLGVKIVPVGIYYSKYNTFRSILHVRYGKPIELKKYQESYEENSHKALLDLKDEMKAATEPLVIDIKTLEFYDLYESVRTMYLKNMAKRLKFDKLTHQNRFKADKMTIKMLDNFAEKQPESMSELKNKLDTYTQLKNKYNLSNQSIAKDKINIFRLIWNALLLLAFSPVFIYGLLNNLIPYIIPKSLVLLVKDTQFHSSIKFVWALFMLPILYIAQALVFWAITDHLLWAVLYLISIGIFGMLAQLYIEWFSIIRRDLWLLKLRNTNKADYTKIKSLYKDLLKSLDDIYHQTNTEIN